MDHDAALAGVRAWLRRHYFGKYRGTVTGNDDQNQQGRLEVEVPAVLGTLRVWAMPCVPYAGDGVGLYLLPEPGTGVWIEFESGDPTYPIWTGCFWGSGQLPDSPAATVKVLRTGSLTVRLDDDASELLISSDSGGETKYTGDVETTAGSATHSVTTSGVTSSKGTGSVEVTDSGTSINGGALEVS